MQVQPRTANAKSNQKKQLPNIRVFARQIPRFSEILNELAIASMTFLVPPS